VELLKAGKSVKVFTVSGKSVKTVNQEGMEEVNVKENELDGEGKFKFLKHSMTMLRWHTGVKVTEVKKGYGVRLDKRKMAWE
jgi:alpha-N-arabinofuranosidase